MIFNFKKTFYTFFKIEDPKENRYEQKNLHF